MKIVTSKLANNFANTFLSIEKHQEDIFKTLLVNSQPHSDQLKRLLIINTPDCLDTTQQQYQHLIDEYSVADLLDKGYIRTVPRLEFHEHEEVKSYILLEFDNIVAGTNPEFRNMVISFTVICNLDEWQLDDFKLRPFQIAGYIDGLMTDYRLGIGRLEFIGASQVVLSENIGGVILRYLCVDPESENIEKEDPDIPTLSQLGNTSLNLGD